jgi:hypothetical protein
MRSTALLFLLSAATPFSSATTDTNNWTLVPVPGVALESGRQLGGQVGDFNHDGRPDILVHRTLAIFENHGNFTFSSNGVVRAGLSASSSAVLTADLDGDGDLDILSIDNTQSIERAKYYENRGISYSQSVLGSVQPLHRASLAATDLDGNGSLDLVTAGFPLNSTSEGLSRTYLRNRFGEYASGLNLRGFGEAFVTAADWNKDSRNDLLLTGTSREPLTLFLTNSPQFLFQDVELQQINLAEASGSWGDLDNDGLLDLVMVGRERSLTGRSLTRVLMNRSGRLIESLTALTNIAGTVLLGDFDSDGDLDVFLNDLSIVSGPSRNFLYLNDGNAQFTRAPIALPNGTSRFAGAADFDGDGDLDIVMGSGQSGLAILRNDAGTNRAPSVPTGLSVRGEEGQMVIQWNPGSDPDQPGGLTYNLRVGTAPGRNDVMPSMSLPDGRRLVPAIGNCGTSTRWILRGLAPGTYHLSVQAIDHSYLASPFSEEIRVEWAEASPSVWPLPASHVSSSGIAFSAVIDSFGEDGLMWFEYGTNFALRTEVQPLRSMPAEQIYFDMVAALIPGSTLEFRAVASNRFGIFHGFASQGTLRPFQSFSLIEASTNGQTFGKLAALNLDDEPGFEWAHAGQDVTAQSMAVRITKGPAPVLESRLLTIESWRQTNTPQFTPSWADFDRDGDLDFTFARLSTDEVVPQLYENRGALLFVPKLPFTNTNSALISGKLAWGDADNDGDLDLIVPLTFESEKALRTRLLLNNGRGEFTDSGLELPFLRGAFASWADFNSDGRMDFLLAGFDPHLEKKLSRLYRNQGAGQFDETELPLPGLTNGEAFWTDRDNDGDLDAFVQGFDDSGTARQFILDNDGAGGFRLLSLPNAFGRGGWGDYNNDGVPDLLAASGNFFVLRAILPDAYELVPFNFTNALPQSAVWLDADRDGALDILAPRLLSGSAAGYGAALYRNNIGTSNHPPATPVNLTTSPHPSGIVLSWAAALDPNQDSGHNYNVRVGTGPAKRDVVSPHANTATGELFINELGNASIRTNFLITGLPPGTYFWSVQAIDHSYAASSFAPERFFVIEHSEPLQIARVNRVGNFLELTISGAAQDRVIVQKSFDLVQWSTVTEFEVTSNTFRIPASDTYTFYRLTRR